MRPPTVPRVAAIAACGLLAASCNTGETAPGAGSGATATATVAAVPPTVPLASIAATPPPPPNPALTMVPASAAPAPGGARSVEARSDLDVFTYAYPAAAGAIGPLRALLDAELDKTRAALDRGARVGASEARRSGFPYHAYETAKTWKVVTDLPGWLSLSAEFYTFTGGAHGMTSFDSLLWDKQLGIRRDPGDLFSTRAGLRAAVKPAFCAALDRERVRKREGNPIGDAVPEFKQCIDPTAATLILGSTDRRAFDRIGFLIEPYSAGPYAEGTYRITLPVTPAIIAAVKPKFQRAFAAR